MEKREEIIERRSERIKHFKLGKGSYAAKIYSRPVHYYDEGSGEYRECDRSLHGDGECWISGNGFIRAKLPKSLEGENRDVGIFRGERYIKWEYLPMRKKKFRDGRLQNASPRQGEESTVYNGVIYPEICKNADLSYEVTENGIKEKIILKAKKRSYKFSFLMTLCGYTAKEGEDGKSVLFEPITAQDEESADTLRMSELFMYDNNGACSDSVSCRLKKINDSKYIITVEPDRSWIESGDRRFPIIIDPTIEYTASFTNNITSRTIASNGSVLYGSSRKVGFESASTEYRTYFEITPASLPDGAVIENVFLNIEWSNPEQMKVLLLCSLSDSVDISTVNWGNKPQEIASIANRIHTMTNSLSANITSAYKASDGALKAVLRAEKNTCDSCSDVIDFMSGDCSLEIEYTLEDYDYSDYQHQYQEYQQIDAGRGRHGEVNLRTGNLSFEIPLLDPDQCFIPFSISLIYDKSMHYYDSWKLSVDQKLVDAAQNQQGIKKIYTDSAGKEHLFVEDKVGNYTNIIEYSGMQARIYNDYLYDGESILFDDGIGGLFGDKLKFDDSGNVCGYTFRENYPGYSYNRDTNNRITEIEVGGKVVVKITYSSNGISQIKDMAGHLTNITCNSSGMITNVTKYDGSNTSFTYLNGKLQTLTTETGMKVQLGYTSEKVSSVVYKAKYSLITGTTANETEGTDIDNINISYINDKKLTAVSGKNGIRTMYLFDDKGRIATVYEDYSYYSYNSQYPHISKPSYTPSISYSYKDGDRDIDSTLDYFIPDMRISHATVDRAYTNYATSGVINSKDESSFEIYFSRYWYYKSNSTFTKLSTSVGYIGNANTYMLNRQNGGSGAVRYGICLGDYSELVNKTTGNMLILSAWLKLTEPSTSSSLIFRTYCMPADRSWTDKVEITLAGNYNGWQYAAIPVNMVNSNEDGDPANPYLVFFEVEYTGSGACYINAPQISALYGESKYLSKYARIQNDQSEYGFELGYVSDNGYYKTVTESKIGHDNIFTQKFIKDRDGKNFTTTTQQGKRYTNDEIVTDYHIDFENVNTIKNYKYDTKKEVETVKGKYGTNNYERVGKYDYIGDTPNEDNNYIDYKMTQSSGDTIKTTKYCYDEHSKLIKRVTDPRGNNIYYTYNNDGSVSSIYYKENEENIGNTMSYNKGLLTSVNGNGTTVNYEYDGAGREKTVKIGNTSIYTKSYSDNDNGSSTVTVNYNNAGTVMVYNDPLGNPVKTTVGGVTATEIKYNSRGAISELIDHGSENKYIYSYDNNGNVSKVYKTDEASSSYGTSDTFITYEYDSKDPSRLLRKLYGYESGNNFYSKGNLKYNYSYKTNSSGAILPTNELVAVEAEAYAYDRVTKDTYGRISSRDIRTDTMASSPQIVKYNYAYNSVSSDAPEHDVVNNCSEYQTKQVSILSYFPGGDYIAYTYDNNGNITAADHKIKTTPESPDNPGTVTITEFTGKVEYVYDGMNRITRENNSALGQTILYEYDNAGNITCKKIYPYSTGNITEPLDKMYEMCYNPNSWKDQMVKVSISCTENNCECTVTEGISYNNIGNPTNYRGKSVTWSKVNQMTWYGNNTFKYGSDGVRYMKNSRSYVYDGDKLLAERWGSQEIEYIYGMDGIIGFVYDGKSYFYRKNLQGDVIEVIKYDRVTEVKSVVARYAYDAYGNHKILLDTNGIGTLNPIRYRGYYYDVETGLYYISKRYYDPETGRFISPKEINAINPNSINGVNLYIYAGNNPVKFNVYTDTLNPINSICQAHYPSVTIYGDNLSISSVNWKANVINILNTVSTVGGFVDASLITYWAAKNPDYFYGLPDGAYSELLGHSTKIGKYANRLSYLLLAYEVIDEGIAKYNNGYSMESIIAGGVVTVGLDLGISLLSGKIGSTIGTAIGGLAGAVIGYVLGVAIGIAIDYAVNEIFDIKINGTRIEDHISNGVEVFLF